jgi:outer membrane protein assembly complex protein YaeT
MHRLLRVPFLALTALAVSGPLAGPGARAADLVAIEGLQSVSAPQARTWIASQLKFVESAGVSRARADDLAFFLENAMRDHGYSDATVEWKIVGEGTSAKILLTASEGNSIVIGDLSIEGNVALEDAAVIELLTSATAKRLKKQPGEALPYVRQDIEQGRGKITSFYKLLGFRNAKVAVEKRIEGARANLLVTVTEGTGAKVGNITFPEAPAPEIADAFETIASEFTGKTYSGAVPGNLASRVRAAVVNAGFFHAKVSAEEKEGGLFDGAETVDLVIVADWGGAVAVSGVRVKGNQKVKTSFFDRHFAKLVDQPYSPAEANEAVNELLQTGAFETVRTDVVAQEGGSYLLDVEIEEGPSRTLGVYGGFTNYEGPIAGFEFRNLNLFGNVRKIDSAIEFSKRGARGEIDYTDPWFLDSAYQFTGGLFALNRQEEGYEKFKTGGRYEFSRRFGAKKHDSIALFGEAAYTDVHDAEIDPIYLGDTEYLSHQLGFSLTRDRRDDPRRPRQGYLAQTSLAAASSALGSEVDYWKASGRLGYYRPVGEHTLRLGARAGLITPMGETDDIPIDLRYFNGGPFSVRSFQERSMGFRDPGSGDPVGGNFFTVFNVEYEIPLAAVTGLSVVPFTDAGNLIFDDSDAGLDDLRYAVGLGLRYETPIGPLRAEYGLNPDQRPGEPGGTFHIGFGLGY